MSEALSSAVERTIRSTLAADIIIANAPDPVFVCDLEGKILEANEAVSRLLGLRRDEVLEQSISRFLGQDETREFVMALREVVERDVTRNVRLQPRSASGEMIPTTLNASALRDTDGNIIGILRDMRELDQARAYAESLIRGISPELLPTSSTTSSRTSGRDGTAAWASGSPSCGTSWSSTRVACGRRATARAEARP